MRQWTKNKNLIMLKTLVLLALAISTMNSCPSNDERCAACVGTQCRVCYNGFVNVFGVCEAVQTRITNCLEYENQFRCKFCQHGFYVNATGVC